MPEKSAITLASLLTPHVLLIFLLNPLCLVIHCHGIKQELAFSLHIQCHFVQPRGAGWTLAVCRQPSLPVVIGGAQEGRGGCSSCNTSGSFRVPFPPTPELPGLCTLAALQIKYLSLGLGFFKNLMIFQIPPPPKKIIY